MTVLNNIRDTVLEQIRPTESEVEKTLNVFKKIQSAIQHISKKKKVNLAFIELEGSSGRKQTQLRNWQELDIFIGLPLSIIPKPIQPEKPEKQLVRKLFNKLVKEVAIEAAKYAGCQIANIAYAEHPYATIILDDYKADLVFCFDLSSEYILKNGPITAVDRTPHHSKFVDSHLNNKQRDDVRLLKAFFHSTFVYGDTSPVGRSGFTGFSTELLIHHHKTIDSALDFLTQDSPKPLDFFNREPDELKRMFSNDFLIIIDPTDPNRNVASSIANRAFRYARYNALKLLQTPEEAFFKRQPIPILTPKELKQLGLNYFVIEFEDRTGWHYTKTRDKIYRYFGKLVKFLKKEPTGEPRFKSVIFEELFHEGLFVIALKIEKPKLSPLYVRKGPFPEFTKGVKQFKEKHPNAYLQNGRYQVKIPRHFTSAEQALHHYLTKNQLSPNLPIIGISHQGTTQLGKQALWILTNAVQPFIKSKLD